jgi:hypothetical protein
MGCCCSKGVSPLLLDRDEVPMLNRETKVEIEEFVRQNCEIRPRAPLFDAMQTTFKNAADVDSSASPVDQGLIDELGSTDSEDAPLLLPLNHKYCPLFSHRHNHQVTCFCYHKSTWSRQIFKGYRSVIA